MTLPETLLFVSTLDGSLHAVSKRTGSIKWTLKEGNGLWSWGDMDICSAASEATFQKKRETVIHDFNKLKKDKSQREERKCTQRVCLKPEL